MYVPVIDSRVVSPVCVVQAVDRTRIVPDSIRGLSRTAFFCNTQSSTSNHGKTKLLCFVLGIK